MAVKYYDTIFGSVDIDHPLVIDLIDLPVFQRLKGIDQAGHPAYWRHYDLNIRTENHNRFIHSVGVYLLLKRFNAPFLEQIAGLLHDISHTAFSHCADYIFPAGSGAEQNYQDNRHEQFIQNTTILTVLNYYGIDADYILNEDNFPLKERNLPDLCADRIEYSLRTAVVAGDLTAREAVSILERLKVHDQKWIFADLPSAKEFAELFRLMNQRYYTGPATAIMFQTVSDYIKRAIAKSYIRVSDLDDTDQEVLAKISRYHQVDPVLKKLFDRIEGRAPVSVCDADNIKVVCKSRIVDPLFFSRGEIHRLSEDDSRWKSIVQLESQPKIYYLNFK